METMSHRLLYNRNAIAQLHQASLGDLQHSVPDMFAAHRLGLWLKCSGAEIFLFTLIQDAVRQMVLHAFGRRQLRLSLDHVHVSGISTSLPELTALYRYFPDCYPNSQFAPAKDAANDLIHGRSRQLLLAELFLLDLLVDNPAARFLYPLYDDAEFAARLDYRALIANIDSAILGTGSALKRNEALSERVKAPMRTSPQSLIGQAEYILKHWSSSLSKNLAAELQVALATCFEEARQRHPGPGPSPTPPFVLEDHLKTPAAFSDDIDWMSNAVLLAKSVYVWLDQMSKRFQRPITTLADIPDEELAQISRWGFNTVWLIGIWERSAASKKIKRLRGNLEAEASAYALHAYRIASDLGGEEALAALEQRCRLHGIRLACDVVPNHTGIDSEWALNHPEWFIQSESPPYPAYRFNGPDLCENPEVSIRIEDGYWNHSDAAVVCEYHDHRTGCRRYIYHGNDGTHMPWNDTSQLNFLMPEVRQAMSDLIVSIAQRFSMIRFDAAMTLARKHFRRLWFPPPGGSAGVPSRSAFCLADEDFNAAFPEEFWREVVKRIKHEAPGTLLIAEAFWLMESYFVRTLGMHRVYNSAFMNMLKREDNQKYRKILKDVLAFNPEILKRYVNFMNNPDEATAIEQFGTGDKYFGVATLLVTLPGLPMFGHGQIEGFREKYGMEYRRAYWQEDPDTGFIAHHEHQVFPLLRLRDRFSGVDNFSLYDFSTKDGTNENVFAYSNGVPGQKVLVVYNNCHEPTIGRIHKAVPKAAAEREGFALDMPFLQQELGLDAAPGHFYRYRTLSGEEHLASVEQLSNGLELSLDGYEHLVFLDFQILDNMAGDWRALDQKLQGRGVNNLDQELLRLHHEPLWREFCSLLDLERLQILSAALGTEPQPKHVTEELFQLFTKTSSVADLIRSPEEDFEYAPVPEQLLPFFVTMPAWLDQLSKSGLPKSLLYEIWLGQEFCPSLGAPLLGWLMLKKMGCQWRLNGPQCFELLCEFGLDGAWKEMARSEDQALLIDLTVLLLQSGEQQPHPAINDKAFVDFITARKAARILGINQYAGQTWFSKEGIGMLTGGIALQYAMMTRLASPDTASPRQNDQFVSECLRQRLPRAAALGYRLDKFLNLM